MIELLRDLHDPIQNAVLPDLVPKEEVDGANSLVLLADRLSEVLFVGAAGVLVAAVGPAFAFYLDAATYLASGLILMGLPSLRPQRLPKTAFFARVKEGIGHLTPPSAGRWAPCSWPLLSALWKPPWGQCWPSSGLGWARRGLASWRPPWP